MERIKCVRGAAAVCAALLLAGCGKSAPGGASAAQGTVTSVTSYSSVTLMTLATTETVTPDIDDDDDGGSEDSGEFDEDDDYDTEDEDEPVSLKLKKEDIDPKKPFEPDKSELGSGKESFAYPMNSIMLTVRQSPYDTAKKKTQLLSGTKVTLLANAFFAFADCWSYISYDGGSGWCHANDLTAVQFEWLDFDGVTLPEKVYDHADFSEGIYDVVSDGVSLLTSPGGEQRGSIKKGSTVRAFGETGSAKGWLFVAVSTEYLDTGGTGELYGWVDTAGGKAIRPEKKGG